MIAALLLTLGVQDTTPAPRLELNEVYRAVSVASPRIAAARALASAAHARVPGAKLPPDPEIQLAFMNYGLPDFAPMDPLGMMQVQVMQMIPTAGKLRYGGRAAGADAAAARERARDVEWDVRSEAAMAFYDLYATDRALAVSRETLRLLQDIRSTAEAMYRVGEGRQADVLRAQVEIGRMAADTLRMRTMRVAMAGRLNALLNRNAEDKVASPLIPAFPAQLPALDSILSSAQTGRPMVRAGEREVEAAGIRSTLARRELWPDLTVGVQYGQRGSAMGIERMGSLMIGASIPIFARSRQLRMRDEMDAMHRMADAELADMRARTRGDVMTTYATLVRARDLAALYRTTIIPQAEAAAASALAAYRVGTVDFMTLLDDRITVNQYREQLYALEAEQGKAWAELEMLIGQELLETRTDR
jgi:outer membrane protein TolC